MRVFGHKLRGESLRLKGSRSSKPKHHLAKSPSAFGSELKMLMMLITAILTALMKIPNPIL